MLRLVGNLLKPPWRHVQAWVLRGSSMYAVPLRVDRTMFLETSLDSDEIQKLLADACPGALVAQTKRKTISADTAEVLYKVCLGTALAN